MDGYIYFIRPENSKTLKETSVVPPAEQTTRPDISVNSSQEGLMVDILK